MKRKCEVTDTRDFLTQSKELHDSMIMGHSISNSRNPRFTDMFYFYVVNKTLLDSISGGKLEAFHI